MPLTEVAAAYVAKKVLEQVSREVVTSVNTSARSRVRGWLGRDPQQLAVAIALTKAEARFIERHPRWYAGLFDQTFLGGAAAPLLARALTRTELVTGADLAHLWGQTAIGGETGARYAAELVGPADDFLDFWVEELGRHEVFRQMLDSRAAEQVAATLEALAAADAPGEAIDRLREDLLEALAQLDRHAVRAGYPYLEDFVDWPSRQRVRNAKPLAGREWVFDLVDDFAERRRSGYLHLVAEAGLGKSAIAAALAERRDAAAFFFGEAAGRTRPEQCLQHLCVSLIRQYGLQHDRLPERAGDDAGFLSRLLSEAVARAGSVWIVIDALDEAQLSRGTGVMPLPEDLPPGAYVLLTHRPGDYAAPSLLNGDAAVETLRIRPDDEQQREDVSAFVQSEVDGPRLAGALATAGTTPSQLADRLIAASEGNFMYVTYVLEHLSGSVTPELPLDELPRGLNGYYGRMWDVIAAEADRDWQDWQRLHLPVIELLAVAGEPVSAAWLAEVMGKPVAEITRRALRAWQRFLLGAEIDGERRWRIVHQSFRDFLVATDEVDLLAAHRRVAETFGPGPGRTGYDHYASRHLSSHLRVAGADDELFGLMDDESWRALQLDLDPSGTLYLHDVQNAWAAAIDADTAAAARGVARPLIARELFCAIEACQLHQTSKVAPPRLLAAALESAARSADQVLDSARLVAEVDDRAAVLAAAAAVVSRARLPDVLALGTALPSPLAAVRVMVAVAERPGGSVRAELEARVWEVIEGIADLESRAAAVTLVADAWPPGRAPARVRLVPEPTTRGGLRLSAAFLPLTDLDERYAAVDELLAALAPSFGSTLIEDSSVMADILTRLAPWATASQIRQALPLAAALPQLTDRCRALAPLFARVRTPEGDAYLARIVDQMEAPMTIGARITALRHVGEALPADAGCRLATVLLNDVATGAPSVRASVLAVAQRWLTPEISERLLDQVLADATHQSPEQRGKTLATLAPMLDEQQLADGLNALGGVRSPSERTEILDAVAPYLSDRLIRVVLDRETARDPVRRARLMAVAARLLPADDRAKAVEAVRAVVAPPAVIGQGASAVAELAALPEEAIGLTRALLDRAADGSAFDLARLGELTLGLPEAERWEAAVAVVERLHGAERLIHAFLSNAQQGLEPPSCVQVDRLFGYQGVPRNLLNQAIHLATDQRHPLLPSALPTLADERGHWLTTVDGFVLDDEAVEELPHLLARLPDGPAKVRVLALIAELRSPEEGAELVMQDMLEKSMFQTIGHDEVRVWSALALLRPLLPMSWNGILKPPADPFRLRWEIGRAPGFKREEQEPVDVVTVADQQLRGRLKRPWMLATSLAASFQNSDSLEPTMQFSGLEDQDYLEVLARFDRPLDRSLIAALADRHALTGEEVGQALDDALGEHASEIALPLMLRAIAPQISDEKAAETIVSILDRQSHDLQLAVGVVGLLSRRAWHLSTEEAQRVLGWLSTSDGLAVPPPQQLLDALIPVLPVSEHAALLHVALRRSRFGQVGDCSALTGLRFEAPFAPLVEVLRAHGVQTQAVADMIVRSVEADAIGELLRTVGAELPDAVLASALNRLAAAATRIAPAVALAVRDDHAAAAAIAALHAAEIRAPIEPLIERALAIEVVGLRATVLRQLARRVLSGDDANAVLVAARSLPRGSDRAAVVVDVATYVLVDAVAVAHDLIVASPDAQARIDVLARIAVPARVAGVDIYRTCAETLQLAAAAGEELLKDAMRLLEPVLVG